MARLHRDLTAAGFDVWFDRVSMPSRSLTFHHEIGDAISACDRILLVVGPKAAESPYVRQEWQFAYFEAEKVVTPVLRRGGLANVPDELKLLHCEDFRDDRQYPFHLKNLVRQLSEPAPVLGKLVGVPPLPPSFLPRPDYLAALRDAVRADLGRPVVVGGAAARVGVHGMGGIGKSVLAAAAARDRLVREAFPDGIVWLTLGPLPAVLELQRRLHKDVGGDGAFQTDHEARVELRGTLRDKRVLVILDDLWRPDHVDRFDVLGPRCRAIITTRDVGLLASRGAAERPHQRVPPLTDAEAMQLLARAAGVERDAMPDEAVGLVTECGGLPLAVALCGGLIGHGFAWGAVSEQLRNSRIDRIRDPNATNAGHESVWSAIDVSVGFLSGDERPRLFDLAVFPGDEAVPTAAIRTLWSHAAGLDDWDADALVIKLTQRSLVQMTSGTANNTTVSLHPLVYDYVRRAAGDETALHRRLLDAYRRKCPGGWHADPPNDGYLLTHLRYHLIGAGLADELADLLHELRWLETKNEAGLAFDLLADFADALRVLPDADGRKRNLRLVDEALRRDVAFIDAHAKEITLYATYYSVAHAPYPQAVFQCLWNRCWWHDAPAAERYYVDHEDGRAGRDAPWRQEGPKLFELMERWRAEKEARTPGFQWLRGLRPPPMPLGHPRLRTCHGHPARVADLHFSPDGRRLASASWDDTVRIWNVADGKRLATLAGHADWVFAVRFSPDGRVVASGSKDGTIRLWTAAGELLRVLTGHSRAVASLCFSPDGKALASGGYDGTVRVWPLAGGKPATLYGQWLPVSLFDSVAFSSDSTLLAAGTRDGAVWIRDASTGEPVTSIRAHRADASGFVMDVAFLPNGHVLSTCYDGTVVVSDPTTGEAESSWSLGTGTGHVARYCDALGTLVAGDYSGRVTVWNRAGAAAAARVAEFWWDDAAVFRAVLSPDGRTVAAGDASGTVRIWDVDERRRGPRLRGHDEGHRPTCLAASNCGRWLATGGTDGNVVVWDARTGLPGAVLPGHAGVVWCAAFSPDGRHVVTGGADATVRIWDVKESCPLHVLRGHECPVSRVRFSRDGKRALSYSQDDFVAFSWDVHTGSRESDGDGPDQRRRWYNERDDPAKMGAWGASTVNNEIVIEEYDDRCTCWYSERLGMLTIMSPDGTWAGVGGRDICFLKVEGDLLPEDD